MRYGVHPRGRKQLAMNARQRAVPAPAPAPKKPRPRVLRSIVATSVIVVLALGLGRAATTMFATRDRSRRIDEIMTTGNAQWAAGEYALAWASFEQAAKEAEEDRKMAALAGRIDPDRHSIPEAQENLAMAWQRNVRLSDDERFSALTNTLAPVLQRGATTAKGIRRADLLAHVGWAYFLRSRDGAGDFDAEPLYRLALEDDPQNPYALVNWGYWILWQHGALSDAMAKFDAAVATGRDLAYVRHIEIAALRNVRSDATDVELLRVVNDMSRNHEAIDASARGELFTIYYFAFMHGAFEKLIAGVPATEQLVLIQSLYGDPGFEESKVLTRDAMIATLQEAAGQYSEALAKWTRVRAALPAKFGGTLRERAGMAIKRLSKQPRTVMSR